MTGVTWHDRAVSVPAYILLGLPCWLGLDCLFSGECLWLPHLLTPLAGCVSREGRSWHGPAGQAVAAALLSLVPKFSLNRLTEALVHIASHPWCLDLALSEAARIICVFYINRNISMPPCVWLLSPNIFSMDFSYVVLCSSNRALFPLYSIVKICHNLLTDCFW